MDAPFDRRGLVAGVLAALPLLVATARPTSALGQGAYAPAGHDAHRAERDFDFFIGAWTVHHRRLKRRLAGEQAWEEFEGETRCFPLLGGMANINEITSHRPGGVTTYGLGLRGYNAQTGLWADWTIDPRDPTAIDAPGVGRFVNGVGDFFSDDTFDNKPIKVRGRFSALGPKMAQWDQAFSPDDGATWETNWIMRYSRLA